MSSVVSQSPSQRHQSSHAGLTPDHSFLWLSLSAKAVFCLAVLMGFKEFQIWDSVREFINYDPWLYLDIPFHELRLNPWWIRTGVVMPSLLLSECTSLSTEMGFAIYATTAVLLSIHLTVRTLTAVLGPSRSRTLVTTIFLLFLSCFMNGRICFAILGASMLYAGHFAWFQGRLGTLALTAINFIALALMTVSTGAFYVGASIVFVFGILAIRDPRTGPAKGQVTLNSMFTLIPTVFLVVHQATLFNEKLARWHDGDYLMFVYHGPLRSIEKYLPSVPPELLLCSLLVGGVACAVSWFGFASTYSVTDTYLATTVLIGIACGAFGYSTLLTNMPGYILFGWTFLQRRQMTLAEQSPSRQLVRRMQAP